MADPSGDCARVVAVAAVTGLAGGLLANSVGFLLAALHLLRRPLKASFASALGVAAVVATPERCCAPSWATSTGRSW